VRELQRPQAVTDPFVMVGEDVRGVRQSEVSCHVGRTD